MSVRFWGAIEAASTSSTHTLQTTLSSLARAAPAPSLNPPTAVDVAAPTPASTGTATVDTKLVPAVAEPDASSPIPVVIERIPGDANPLAASTGDAMASPRSSSSPIRPMRLRFNERAVLGLGSDGTVVLQGEFAGRTVAVKRTSKLHCRRPSASEISFLLRLDGHPNVIRYYCAEEDDTHCFIALDLYPASLYDVIESRVYCAARTYFDPLNASAQMIAGLRYLHSCNVVHRDLKPSNILVADPIDNIQRVVISDFGLCREIDLVTFNPTTNRTNAGTPGWQAPEIMYLAEHRAGAKQLTNAIDLFAAGCLIHYTIDNGTHPFGNQFQRVNNIYTNNVLLAELAAYPLAKDLVLHLVDADPEKRTPATDAFNHPCFWPPRWRSEFLQDSSDLYESMDRALPKGPAKALVELEKDASSVVGSGWLRKLDSRLANQLVGFRKYDRTSVQDLLRAFRNTKHHYHNFPPDVQALLGPLPDGPLVYFTKVSPALLMHVHRALAASGLNKHPALCAYF